MSAAEFGKVALLLGGDSPEREISLMSGERVACALDSIGADYFRFDPAGGASLEEIKRRGATRAFIILHGGRGENGAVQGALEMMGIPYTGSGVAACALAMDKYRAKLVWQAGGVPTPPFVVACSKSDLPSAAALGYPLFVKPVYGGSSIGARAAEDDNALLAAYQEAAQYDDGDEEKAALIEPRIRGAEYTAGIVDGEVLPLIRVEANAEFYDYRAKYFSDSTGYFCPCGLGAGQEARLQSQAKKAFDLLGGRGWGRVDFMVANGGEAQFLEANTVPGMTEHSLVPMAAHAAGVTFDELIARILRAARCGD
jgi:D-alanine-D-alanine ligase